MSEKIKGFVVALDENYREEDVNNIITAIKQLKGVLSVKENVVNANDYINTVRITNNVRKKLYEIADELE